MTSPGRTRRESWLAMKENLKIAIGAIRANKLRSVLTVLGNVVAVMSVIMVVAVIDGVNTYVGEKILEQGLQVITIDKFGLITDDDAYRDAEKRRDLTLREARALEQRMHLASRVVAQVDAVKRVRAGKNELANVSVKGTTAGYDEVGKFEVVEGRHLDPSDVERRRPVAVIGSEVAEALYPRLDPIGQRLKVSGHELLVVGVLKSRGNVLGQSQDNVVITTLGQFEKMYGTRRSLTLLVKGAPGTDLERVEDEARVVLRAERHVPIGKPDDFGISTAETFRAIYQSLTGGIFAGTIALVAISLVVGGIVIMNIMLVAVTERTREIGLRKSLGARRSDLVGQFLSEAVVLSTFGGVLGVAAGVGFALIVRAVTPLPASIQPWSVLISLGVASSVGLFFGVYPATRAAQLDPIVALRQE